MSFGFGRGFGRGMGFGFRGSSPPWPYVGRGRGGLPRCGYFFSGAAGAPAAWPYQQPPYPGYPATPFTPQYTPSAPPVSKEQELEFLKDQAEAIKGQLEQIGAKIGDLESEE